MTESLLKFVPIVSRITMRQKLRRIIKFCLLFKFCWRAEREVLRFDRVKDCSKSTTSSYKTFVVKFAILQKTTARQETNNYPEPIRKVNESWDNVEKVSRKKFHLSPVRNESFENRSKKSYARSAHFNWPGKIFEEGKKNGNNIQTLRIDSRIILTFLF